MKQLSLYLVALTMTIGFISCQKEVSNKADQNLATEGLTKAANGNLVLDLRPNAATGQDVYVEWKADDPSTANVNFNYVAEMNPVVWTDGGSTY